MYQVGQQFEAKVKTPEGNQKSIIVVIIDISNDVITLRSVDTHFNGSLNQFHNGGGGFVHVTSKIKINDNGTIEMIEDWKYE